jgi:hypothetical protein
MNNTVKTIIIFLIFFHFNPRNRDATDVLHLIEPLWLKLLRHQLVASETLPIDRVIHDAQILSPVAQLPCLLCVLSIELFMRM